MNNLRQLLLSALLLAAILPLPAAAQGDPPVGRFDIGGYSLYIECAGEAVEGVPIVIMEHDLATIGHTWLPVQRNVAGFARVCTYDRAGQGGSDPSPLPRTADTFVTELHALLEAANVPGPYILVGLKWGGMTVRLFAYRYPEEVVGMVLVDAEHEDQDAAFADLGMPEEVTRNRTTWSTPEGVTLANREATLEQVRATRSDTPGAPILGDMPLVVLSRGQFRARVNQNIQQAMERYLVWRSLQQDLASLSTNSVIVLARNTEEAIQNEQPAIITTAIRAVVEAARSGLPLDFEDPQPPDIGSSSARPTATATPIAVNNPLFPAGTTLTIPPVGVVYQLRIEPGSLMLSGICSIGAAATAGETVLAADGKRWIRLDCAGSIGWAPEADFAE